MSSMKGRGGMGYDGTPRKSQETSAFVTEMTKLDCSCHAGQYSVLLLHLHAPTRSKIPVAQKIFDAEPTTDQVRVWARDTALVLLNQAGITREDITEIEEFQGAAADEAENRFKRNHDPGLN